MKSEEILNQCIIEEANRIGGSGWNVVCNLAQQHTAEAFAEWAGRNCWIHHTGSEWQNSLTNEYKTTHELYQLWDNEKD